MLEEPYSTYTTSMSFTPVDAERRLHRHYTAAFPSFHGIHASLLPISQSKLVRVYLVPHRWSGVISPGRQNHIRRQLRWGETGVSSFSIAGVEGCISNAGMDAPPRD